MKFNTCHDKSDFVNFSMKYKNSECEKKKTVW